MMAEVFPVFEPKIGRKCDYIIKKEFKSCFLAFCQCIWFYNRIKNDEERTLFLHSTRSGLSSTVLFSDDLREEKGFIAVFF